MKKKRMSIPVNILYIKMQLRVFVSLLKIPCGRKFTIVFPISYTLSFGVATAETVVNIGLTTEQLLTIEC